jgi:hypothetical protein
MLLPVICLQSFEFEADPVKLTHRQHQQHKQHNQQSSKARACANSSGPQQDPQQLNKLLPADTEQHCMSGHSGGAHRPTDQLLMSISQQWLPQT